MAETQTHPPHSLGGKVAGMFVFLIGVALLLLVFYLAYHFFTGLAAAISSRPPANPQQGPSLLMVLARGVVQLGMLFIMGYAGSMVASKGLELFGVSRGVSAK